MNHIQCSVAGCDRRGASTHGWCDMHWKRWARYGDPEKTLRPRHSPNPVCSVDSCNQKTLAKGLCSRHWQLSRKPTPVVEDLPGEKWKPVPGYEGLYEVSDLGRIRSETRTVHRMGADATIRGRILKTTAPMKDGVCYERAHLYRNRKRTDRTVHSMVAEAFHGPRPAGMVVRHLDGNSLNNTPGNLQYGTQVENMEDMRRHGNAIEQTKTHCVNGHEYTDENTVFIGNKGTRRCGKCIRVQASERNERAKAKRAAKRAALRGEA